MIQKKQEVQCKIPLFVQCNVIEMSGWVVGYILSTSAFHNPIKSLNPYILLKKENVIQAPI